MTKVKIDDISLNIAEDNVSIVIRESESDIMVLTVPCTWGSAMFGEPCILGEGTYGRFPYMALWGEASFGDLGILGEPGAASALKTFRQYNVIRTN